MRWAVLILLLISGCAQAEALSMKEKCRLGAWIALNISKKAAVAPVAPDSGDVCPDCGGKGVLPGDGVIRPICKTCNGTGKKPKKEIR